MKTIMINKTVRLTEDQIAGLKKEAARQNRKWTEMVRIAVDKMLGDAKVSKKA